MSNFNPFSIQPFLFTLFTIAFGWTLYLERSWINRIFASPLLILSLGIYLRAGLGLALLYLSPQNIDDHFISEWTSSITQLQLLWLPLQFGLLLYAIFENTTLLRWYRISVADSYPSLLARSLPIRRTLCAIYQILTIFFAVYLLSSELSNAFSRDFETYYHITQLLWRFDTPTTALMRLRDMWLFLTPIYYRILPSSLRFTSLFLMAAFFISALLSGSRGLLLYPCLLISFGLAASIKTRQKIILLFLSLFALTLILIPTIYVLRETSSFQSAQHPVERLKILISLPSKDLSSISARLPYTGRDLYACHDPFLFKPANQNQLNYGWQSINAFPWLFVPKHLFPDQPPIFDGHLIAKRLQGISPSRWSSVWFPCISLPADLYRRFNITGLLTGSILTTIIIGFISTLWKKLVTPNHVPGPFQILLWSFPFTYIQSYPLGTLSETSWFLLWDLPKYLLVFLVLSRASNLLFIKDTST